MAKQQQMQMPGVFGGLMRYDSEYKSKFMFSPAIIVAFTIAIIIFVLALKIFFPINIPAPTGGVPVGGHGGAFWSLLEGLI